MFIRQLHLRRGWGVCAAAMTLAVVCACMASLSPVAFAGSLIEQPAFTARVASGELPPVSQRAPSEPSIVPASEIEQPGKYGGTMRMLMGRSKDIRMMAVYGYARLVCYNRKYDLVPDLLHDITVEADRVFTFKIRKGHRWSDGHPFTSEDFRYYWENMALDKVISPLGPPTKLIVNDEQPKFEVLDELTVRYTWSRPNPYFLPALAGARPLYLYKPAHYLKQFHASFADKDTLDQMVKQTNKRDWRALHFSKDRPYRFDNPKLPTLQPWYNTTKPPSERFIFARNPYYHRIDEQGHQLPYIDNVTIQIASSGLIPAKVGTGEADLQARSLAFKNFTFLKQGEQRNNYKVRLWRSGRGSQMALFPNLNASDPTWRKLLRNASFRRALSLAIDRDEINQSIFFGLGILGNNTILPDSPLYKDEYREKWAGYDIDQANKLLDSIGLDKRTSSGTRLLPDGRELEIIIESAGEGTEQSDVLQLITDHWAQIGVKLFTKPTRREVLRQRVKSGATIMSIFFGLDNGVATADFAPGELVPTNEDQLQWPLWGRYHANGGKAGEAPDLPAAKRLMELYNAWTVATGAAAREKIWHEILAINADNVFSIGIIAGVPQPVVINVALRNVPEEGLYNWNPGAHFGVYRPDTFWFSK